ncbi:MAG TPA: hypothetical protein PLC42_02390 [Parachlamydiaceae bacterium]|nr:hypothetical protein [Parachlamydiaceae bacterium]
MIKNQHIKVFKRKEIVFICFLLYKKIFKEAASMNLKAEKIAFQNVWGRASTASVFTLLSCFFIMSLTPLLVFYFYISGTQFSGSLSGLAAFLLQHAALWKELFPAFSMSALAYFFFWVFFQGLLALMPDFLHKWIPSYQGGVRFGAVTPAGNCLAYNINGLQAWAISHILFIVCSFGLGLFSPTIIFDYFGPLLWVANGFGFLLGIFAYVKALYFPSFKEDRKFSGNRFYDFYMGVELNPRVQGIDLKLFFNGRPGIVAWTLINLSFASAQYAKFGTVTNSMLIVNFLQALYVLYFFWKEAWYLKTIDIHHDHFGWMLAWGDSVFLPYMYTLQAFYLVFNPVELSSFYALFVLVLGMVGFYIFDSANNQKDYFRKHGKEARIWNSPVKSLECSYQTEDGKIRESNLLLSGWWKISRHMNYTGDLILSLAYSLACGIDSLFPYFYFVFLSILLVHRCIRDEGRCSLKYGEKWKLYCKEVPYRLIPYIW